MVVRVQVRVQGKQEGRNRTDPKGEGEGSKGKKGACLKRSSSSLSPSLSKHLGEFLLSSLPFFFSLEYRADLIICSCNSLLGCLDSENFTPHPKEIHALSGLLIQRRKKKRHKRKGFQMGKDEKLMESSSGKNGGFETQVVLNVYDLTPLNHYTSWFGFGIFHSGIAVHGMEYGFGAHDFPVSGVFEVEPRSCPGFIYRCSILLGRINMPPSEFRAFIESVASEYHGDTYHLITKNCNHFTDDMSYRLTGKRIPGWVNRLARVGALCSCLLPESLQVTSVKQLPEYHEYLEDGMESSSTDGHRDHTESDDAEQEKALLSLKSGNSDVSFIRETEQR